MSEELAIIEKKKAAWSEMGLAIHTTEMSLQAKAQEAINAIVFPTTIDEVTNAEVTLKTLKASQTSIENDRKTITEKFRAVADRLMGPEKSLAEPIKKLTDCIIGLKKEHELVMQKKQQKDNESKSVFEAANKFLSGLDAHYKKKILDQITNAHKWALENDVTMDKLNEYVSKCADKFNLMDFTFDIKTAQIPNTFYITKEEAEQIFIDIVLLDANDYLEQYRNDLQAKFEFYQLDYSNKQLAIAKSKEEAEKALGEIAEQKNNSDLAATLNTISTPLNTVSEVKALKKLYKVEMPDDIKSAITIMTAFTSNLQLCQPKLRVKNMLKLSVDQMAESLAKVKCDDNSFSVTGIIFKEEVKL